MTPRARRSAWAIASALTLAAALDFGLARRRASARASDAYAAALRLATCAAGGPPGDDAGVLGAQIASRSDLALVGDRALAGCAGPAQELELRALTLRDTRYHRAPESVLAAWNGARRLAARRWSDPDLVADGAALAGEIDGALVATCAAARAEHAMPDGNCPRGSTSLRRTRAPAARALLDVPARDLRLDLAALGQHLTLTAFAPSDGRTWLATIDPRGQNPTSIALGKVGSAPRALGGPAGLGWVLTRSIATGAPQLTTLDWTALSASPPRALAATVHGAGSPVDAVALAFSPLVLALRDGTEVGRLSLDPPAATPLGSAAMALVDGEPPRVVSYDAGALVVSGLSATEPSAELGRVALAGRPEALQALLADHDTTFVLGRLPATGAAPPRHFAARVARSGSTLLETAAPLDAVRLAVGCPALVAVGKDGLYEDTLTPHPLEPALAAPGAAPTAAACHDGALVVISRVGARLFVRRRAPDSTTFERPVLLAEDLPGGDVTLLRVGTLLVAAWPRNVEGGRTRVEYLVSGDGGAWR